jgi:hypothetical protein
MDNKNINLTLVTPDEDKENEIVISFSTIFDYAKRFFCIWIVLAIIIGFFVTGVSMILQKSFYVGDATALISLNYDGVEDGLDPNGDELDITKIKSPSVIENALSNLDISVSKSDSVRKNITITGVVPESTMDEMSLYYDVFSNGASGALEAAKQMISTSYYSTQYIISFNYFNSGFSLETGKEILNEVLNSYRSYFFETYNYNVALGSAVSVVDYSTYDYAEAVNIFSNSLDSLEEYLNNLKTSDTSSFRSSQTGYSFDDLLSTVDILKNVDLDRVSSYITINNVTKNDKDSMVSYYKYLIQDLNKQKAVSQSTIDSIDDSLEKYEKDPLILVVGTDSDSDNDDATNETQQTTSTDLNQTYDELITQKLEEQKKVSEYNKDIKYYNTIVTALSKSNSVKESDIEKVEGYLSTLNTKINELISDVNDTSEDFYSNVAFADAYKILVPASGSETEVISGNVKTPVILSEAILFIVYVMIFVIGGIVTANKNKKSKSELAEKTETSEETE